MQIEFRVGRLRVKASSADPRIITALEAAWGPVLVEPGVELSSDVEEAKVEFAIEGTSLLRNGAVVREADVALNLCRALEGELLEEITAAHQGYTLLHAAGLLFGVQLVLFVGESDAGKSTMTRQSLLAGAAYLSDDFMLLKDNVLHGVARTVQFDAVGVGEVTNHVRDCDTESYPAWFGTERQGRVPLFRGNYRYAGPLNMADRSAVLISLRHGDEDQIEELSSLERLSRLHAASLTSGAPYRSGLDRGPGFELTWNDPEHALTLLLRKLGLSPGESLPEAVQLICSSKSATNGR